MELQTTDAHHADDERKRGVLKAISAQSIPLLEVSNVLRTLNLTASEKKKIKRDLLKFLKYTSRENPDGDEQPPQKKIISVVDRTHVIKELGPEFEDYVGNFGRLAVDHAKPPVIKDIHGSLVEKGIDIPIDRLKRIVNDSLSLPKQTNSESDSSSADRLINEHILKKYGSLANRPSLRTFLLDMRTDHPEWFNLGKGRGLNKQVLETWIHTDVDKRRRHAPYIVNNIIAEIREAKENDPTLSIKEKEQDVTLHEVIEKVGGAIPTRQLQAIVRAARPLQVHLLDPLTFGEFDAVMTYIYYDQRMMLGRDRLLGFFSDMTEESAATFFKPWMTQLTRVRAAKAASDTRASNASSGGAKVSNRAKGTTKSRSKRRVGTAGEDDATVEDGEEDGGEADADVVTTGHRVQGRVKVSKINPYEMPSVLDRADITTAEQVVDIPIAALLHRIKLTVTKARVMQWIRSQEVHQIFFPAKQKRTFAPTILKEPYSQIAVDLISLEFAQSNGKSLVAGGGFVFVLTAIDMFSKRAFAVPLLTKSASAVLNAFEYLFRTKRTFDVGTGNSIADLDTYPRFNQHPRVIRSDNGTEFTNKDIDYYFLNDTMVLPSIFKKELDLAENGFTHTKQIFSQPYTPQSNGAIERFNKFLKRQLNMYTTQTSSGGTWVEVLPRILKAYNATKSRITGLSPDEIDGVYMSRPIPIDTISKFSSGEEKERERVAKFEAVKKPTHAQIEADAKARASAEGRAILKRKALALLSTEWVESIKSEASQRIRDRLNHIQRDIREALAPQFKKLLGKDLCQDLDVGSIVRLHQYLSKNMGENWSRQVYRIYSKQCIGGNNGGEATDTTPLRRPLVRVQLLGRDPDGRYTPRPFTEPQITAVLVNVLLKERIYIAEIDGSWLFVSTTLTNLVNSLTELYIWTPVTRGQERGTWRRKQTTETRLVTRATMAYLAAAEVAGASLAVDMTQTIGKFREGDIALFYELNGIEGRLYHEHEVLKVDAVMNPLKSEPKYIIQRLVRPILVTKKNVVVASEKNTRNDECHPYYIVKWSGYDNLTKEPRKNLPQSLVKRFEKRNEVVWSFVASYGQNFATDVQSKLDAKELTYRENDVYKTKEEDTSQSFTVGDFFIFTHGKKKYIGQVMHFVHGGTINAGDKFEEFVDFGTSKRDVQAQEWKYKSKSSSGATFVLNPLKDRNGEDIFTVVKRSEIVKIFKPTTYNSTDDGITLDVSLAEENKLIF